MGPGDQGRKAPIRGPDLLSQEAFPRGPGLGTPTPGHHPAGRTSIRARGQKFPARTQSSWPGFGQALHGACTLGPAVGIFQKSREHATNESKIVRQMTYVED